MHNVSKWSDTLQKLCSKCCKICKVCLAGHCIKGLTMKVVAILPNFSTSSNGVDPYRELIRTPWVPLRYCSKWFHQFAVEAFGQFRDGTGSGNLELAKGAENKWRNHPKLPRWVFSAICIFRKSVIRKVSRWSTNKMESQISNPLSKWMNKNLYLRSNKYKKKY